MVLQLYQMLNTSVHFPGTARQTITLRVWLIDSRLWTIKSALSVGVHFAPLPDKMELRDAQSLLVGQVQDTVQHLGVFPPRPSDLENIVFRDTTTRNGITPGNLNSWWLALRGSIGFQAVNIYTREYMYSVKTAFSEKWFSTWRVRAIVVISTM